jgi:hypothetical protein
MSRIFKIGGIVMVIACCMATAWSAEDGKNLVSKKWRPYKSGIGKVVIQKDGIIACDVTGGTKKDASGVQQAIVLNQKVAKPIFISAECKAEKVLGKAGTSFSLYMDVKHTDGTSTWGQGIKFTPGTYDWKKFTATYVPKKPIKSISFLLLLRWRSGKAWFKNAVCKEVEAKK